MNVKKLTITIVPLLMLSCATNDQNKQAKTGAAVGGVLGGIIGQITGGDNQSVISGTILGGMLGVTIGGYMDAQAKELEKELGSSGVKVKRNGDKIILDIPESITFDTAKFNLNPKFHTTLDGIVDILKKYAKTTIEVSGHTDSVGSEEYNQKLSKSRANSVGDYLISKSLDKDRIVVVGYGEVMPVASNNTELDRSLNRRVEILIIPPESKP